ncbi:MFS transporter [Purpureocillium lavendulum]|uniref:MFS transporter n=1 Tax=Purpureocillium lavendulum TaxID=1247861 RepID=A0AB34FWT4_9HYPO|nr:MFS transporter [Purpureocillium lavendulum]
MATGMNQPEGPAASTPSSARASPDDGHDADTIEPVHQESGVEAYRSASHVSGPDAFHPDTNAPAADTDEANEIYDRLGAHRKSIIVAVCSFCAFLSPMSSTSVLAATPEVAADYHTTGSIINVSNAGYMVFMGISPVVWGPMSEVFGRRVVLLVTAVLFFLLSLGTALAPNLASFFVFRAASAFEGTSFILLGAACLGDIYRPTERGTAIGWFLSGTLIGPAFGPFIGGIIVTYASWRAIFWLQTALAGTAVLGVYFLVPETIHHKKYADLEGYSAPDRMKALLSLINPIRPLRLFRYWNQVLVACGSSALVWNMYSLLTPIRYVLNPRFHLESPLLSGLFYLAPGCGYLLGTFMGGRWADRTVRLWIKRRNGVRVPEDRLRSAVPFMGILMPACILIYGWAVDKAVGGIPLPVIVLFLQGVGQLFCFPSLNTYCLDVMPGQGAEVTAANYFVRYLAGCLGTAVVLPAIEGVGVGWFQTISALFLVASTVGVMAAIRWGEGWRKATDANKARERMKKTANRGASPIADADTANAMSDKEDSETEMGMDGNEKSIQAAQHKVPPEKTV